MSIMSIIYTDNSEENSQLNVIVLWPSFILILFTYTKNEHYTLNKKIYVTLKEKKKKKK